MLVARVRTDDAREGCSTATDQGNNVAALGDWLQEH